MAKNKISMSDEKQRLKLKRLWSQFLGANLTEKELIYLLENVPELASIAGEKLLGIISNRHKIWSISFNSAIRYLINKVPDFEIGKVILLKSKNELLKNRLDPEEDKWMIWEMIERTYWTFRHCPSLRKRAGMILLQELVRYKQYDFRKHYFAASTPYYVEMAIDYERITTVMKLVPSLVPKALDLFKENFDVCNFFFTEILRKVIIDVPSHRKQAGVYMLNCLKQHRVINDDENKSNLMFLIEHVPELREEAVKIMIEKGDNKVLEIMIELLKKVPTFSDKVEKIISHQKKSK